MLCCRRDGRGLQSGKPDECELRNGNAYGSRFHRCRHTGSAFAIDYSLAEPESRSRQLYSTASYQAHDLAGIDLGANDLTEGNFVGQNLRIRTSDAASTLHWVVQYFLRKLVDADFTGADTRGAAYLDHLDFSGATATNLIRPDGHINGLDLDADGLLVVRDYAAYLHDPTPSPFPSRSTSIWRWAPAARCGWCSRRTPGIRRSPSRPASRSRSAARWNSPSPTT